MANPVSIGKLPSAIKAESFPVDVIPSAISLVEKSLNLIGTPAEVEAQKEVELARIEAELTVELTKIREQTALSRKFLDQINRERTSIFHELFRGLNKALDMEVPVITEKIIAAILDLAKTSPLDAMKNLRQLNGNTENSNCQEIVI